MASKELVDKILNPIRKNVHLTSEVIYGNWDDIKWGFNIFRNKEFKAGKNLVVFSFFLLKEVTNVYSFQRKEKENFKSVYDEKLRSYFRGVKSIIKNSKKANLDITVRIYCDITTARNVAKYLFEKNVEIFVYYFPQFFDHKDLVHFSFFGTIVRYLPLFKIKKHNDDNWNTVTITDIDTPFINELKLLRYYLENQENLPNIFFRNKSCYYLIPRLIFLKMKPPCFSIISSFILQRKPQDPNILIHFLSQCLLLSCQEYNNVVKKYIPLNLSKQPLKGRLEYGVDEYFINFHFLKKAYIDENKDLLEAFIKDKDNIFYRWITLLESYKPTFKKPELVETFIKIAVKLFFSENYKLPEYKNTNELIKIFSDEYKKQDILLTKTTKDKYEKLIEVIKKIGPENLFMPDTIFPCIERQPYLISNENVIRIVKPNPKYPDFVETNVKIIPYFEKKQNKKNN